MEFEITSISCCVPLSEIQWKKLNKLDERGDIENYDAVYKAVSEAGGYNIEYNGHFGRNFFFDAKNKVIARKVCTALKKILKS